MKNICGYITSKMEYTERLLRFLAFVIEHSQYKINLDDEDRIRYFRTWNISTMRHVIGRAPLRALYVYERTNLLWRSVNNNSSSTLGI